MSFRFNAWGERWHPYADDDALAGRIGDLLGLPVIAVVPRPRGRGVLRRRRGHAAHHRAVPPEPEPQPDLDPGRHRAGAARRARHSHGRVAALRALPRHWSGGDRRACRRSRAVRRRPATSSSSCRRHLRRPTSPAPAPTSRCSSAPSTPAAASSTSRSSTRARTPTCPTPTTTSPTAGSWCRSSGDRAGRRGARRPAPRSTTGYDVVGVPGEVLAYGGGGPHCITQQIPAGRGAAVTARAPRSQRAGSGEGPRGAHRARRGPADRRARLAQVRVSDVAERAGISTGHVTYYFPTKSALLVGGDPRQRGAADRGGRAVGAAGAGPLAPARPAAWSCRRRPGPGDQGWVLWFQVWHEASLDPTWRARAGRARRPLAGGPRRRAALRRRARGLRGRRTPTRRPSCSRRRRRPVDPGDAGRARGRGRRRADAAPRHGAPAGCSSRPDRPREDAVQLTPPSATGSSSSRWPSSPAPAAPAGCGSTCPRRPRSSPTPWQRRRATAAGTPRRSRSAARCSGRTTCCRASPTSLARRQGRGGVRRRHPSRGRTRPDRRRLTSALQPRVPIEVAADPDADPTLDAARACGST